MTAATSRLKSKLAVILHADVVGSTALVQRDEALAHERIRNAFRRLSEVVRAYSGTPHEVRGDALLAEFSRASDAVSAALGFQIANVELNGQLDDGVSPRVRIGISLGEIIIADGTLTGPDVVLAQRLEQLAPADGVCISDSVRQSMPTRMPFEFQDLGEQAVKGFDNAVKAWSVSLSTGAALPEPDAVPRALSLARRPSLLLTLIVACAIAGGWWWMQSRVLFEPVDPVNMALRLPDRPSIAVLPFNNMSGDEEQEFFADGMTEDLITDLSKVSGLFVIARNSTFGYKGKSVKVREVAQQLGVRYVLEGSVRRAGGKVRINAQLIDATTGGHVWAERYDAPAADVFAIQDNVTQKIVTALAVQLSPAEDAVLKAGGTANSDAYDAFLLGVRANNATGEVDFDSNNEALKHFKRALELDPEYALAYAGLAVANWLRFSIVTRSDFSARDKAFELANKSLALGENALAHRVLAKKYLAPRAWEIWGGSRESIDFDSAVAELRKALSLEPNNADAMAELAFALVLKGEPQTAVTQMDKAKRLNPDFPDWYHLPAGIAYYLNEEYDRAVREFDALYASQKWSVKSAYWLSAAYAQAGNERKAREIADATKAHMMGPQYVQHVSDGYPFAKNEHIEMLHEGLRKAGVPDFRNQ